MYVAAIWREKKREREREKRTVAAGCRAQMAGKKQNNRQSRQGARGREGRERERERAEERNILFPPFESERGKRARSAYPESSATAATRLAQAGREREKKYQTASFYSPPAVKTNPWASRPSVCVCVCDE